MCVCSSVVGCVGCIDGGVRVTAAGVVVMLDSVVVCVLCCAAGACGAGNTGVTAVGIGNVGRLCHNWWWLSC